MKSKVMFCLLIITSSVSLFSQEKINSRVNLLSFDTTMQNYFPIGRYAMYTSYNYGLTSQLNMNLKKVEELRIFSALSVSNNTIVLEDVNYIIDMYMVIGIGWNVDLGRILPLKGLSITPGIGYGWMPHLANGGYWTNGEKKTHFFQDQIIMAQLELAYELKYLFKNIDYTVLLTPSYVHFVEEEYDGQEFGFNVGLRIPLNRDNNYKRVNSEKIKPIEPVIVKRDEAAPIFKDENNQHISKLNPTNVTIIFDKAIDESTPADKIIYKTFISDSPEFTINNTNEYSAKSIGAAEINISNLKPGKEYYAYSIAQDISNNYIQYNTISFTTPELINNSGFNLGNNAIEVDLRKVLEVEFNSDIDIETINNDTVYVRSGNTYIKGELQYKNRILKFIPQEDFLQGEKHNFVITTELMDTNKNTLDEDAIFTFTALDYNDIFAHWKFDHNTYDSSGNNHTATLKSVKTEKLPTFIDIDELGNGGLHFVGGYNWGTYIDLGTIDMGDTFTIAGWVKIEEPPAEYSQKIMTLISNGDAGAVKDGFKVFFNNWNRDDKRIVIETGNKTQNKNSETQEGFIAYNNWYHVAVVINRTIGQVKLYFNGFEAETTNNGAILNDFNTNAPLHIAHFKDGYFHYNGYIDDFRIYKKVITAEDIKTIARGK